VIFSRPIRLSLIVLCGIILPHTGVSAKLFQPHACSISSDLVTDVSGQVDLRIAGLTASGVTKGVFVTRGDSVSPWATSSSVWTASGDSVDWSGASPWNSNGGYNFAGTLVTPRHLLFANHYQIGTGAVVLFVAPDNSVVTRTLSAQQSIPGTDITVGMLDSDVPDSITHYPVLSASKFEAYVRDGVDESLFDLPIIAFDQEDHAIIRNIRKSSLYGSDKILHMPASSGGRVDFNETLISGDSGNPMFLLVGDKPVLISSHYYDYYGPNYSYYHDQIEQTIDFLGGNHDLSDLDLGCFNAPIVITANQSMAVMADDVYDGMAVGMVGIDQNVEGGAPYFSIVAGNSDGVFSISSSTGSVSIASSSIITSAAGFPRSIVVQVEDGGIGGRLSLGVVGVSLSSHPFFIPSSHVYDLDENTASGTQVARIRAADYDDDALSYSILSGNNAGAFSIHPSNGMLSVASSSALDYETSPSFTLVIEARESYTGPRLFATTSVSVSLRDLTTSFDELSYSFSLREDSPVGTVVGRVDATVADDDYVPYYEIVSGNDDDIFSVGSSTGIITVSDDSMLEYDNARSYPLVVGVSAGSGLSTEATALVSIQIQEFVPVTVPVVTTSSSRSSRGGGGGGSRSVGVPAQGSLTGTVPASQASSVSSLIQLLIAMNVISPDKASLAQSLAQAQAPAYSPQPSSVRSTSAQSASRPLSPGSTGEGIRSLQKALNSKGFIVASSGPGSVGLETSYFGPATEDALKRFQCRTLSVCSGTPTTTGYGNLGPMTRSLLYQ
jgi:hypothetical protein